MASCMAGQSSDIRDTILTSRSRDGDMLSLLVRVDGRYCIARDGRPLPEMWWRADQLDEAVTALVKMSGLDRSLDR